MKALFRVTDLDSMIWYNNLENMSVADMRERLLRTGAPNAKMEIGTTWHSILEDAPDYIDIVEKNGIKFNIHADSQIIMPQIKEIRVNKVYMVDGDEIELSGKCDGITGNLITDHKLTFHEDVETYFDSYQWRAYLDIFNADVFQYYIYSAKEDKDCIAINNVSTLKMYRYPEMYDDIVKGIRDLVRFVKSHVPELISSRQG